MTVEPKQVQGQSAQSGQHRCTGAVIAEVIFMELGVAEPVSAFRLVRKRCRWRDGLPARLPLATSSTIQLLPGQSSVIKSGACLALSVQVVSRP